MDQRNGWRPLSEDRANGPVRPGRQPDEPGLPGALTVGSRQSAVGSPDCLLPTADCLPPTLDLPPLAILLAEVLLRLRRVRHLSLGGVPGEFLSAAIGDVPQKDRLSEHAAVREWTRRRAIPVASLDPLLVMADRCRDRLLRARYVLELLLGKQLVLG